MNEKYDTAIVSYGIIIGFEILALSLLLMGMPTIVQSGDSSRWSVIAPPAIYLLFLDLLIGCVGKSWVIYLLLKNQATNALKIIDRVILMQVGLGVLWAIMHIAVAKHIIGHGHDVFAPIPMLLLGIVDVAFVFYIGIIIVIRFVIKWYCRSDEKTSE
ncbi:MAG: hypothetical protein WCJ56_04705 [bacterium]